MNAVISVSKLIYFYIIIYCIAFLFKQTYTFRLYWTPCVFVWIHKYTRARARTHTHTHTHTHTLGGALVARPTHNRETLGSIPRSGWSKSFGQDFYWQDFYSSVSPLSTQQWLGTWCKPEVVIRCWVGENKLHKKNVRCGLITPEPRPY